MSEVSFHHCIPHPSRSCPSFLLPRPTKSYPILLHVRNLHSLASLHPITVYANPIIPVPPSFFLDPQNHTPVSSCMLEVSIPSHPFNLSLHTPPSHPFLFPLSDSPLTHQKSHFSYSYHRVLLLHLTDIAFYIAGMKEGYWSSSSTSTLPSTSTVGLLGWSLPLLNAVV